jgi:hypothetical protein
MDDTAGSRAAQVRCLECGAENAETAQVCVRCGAPLGLQEPVAAAPAAGGSGSSIAPLPASTRYGVPGQRARPGYSRRKALGVGVTLAGALFTGLAVTNELSWDPTGSSTSSTTQPTGQQLRTGNAWRARTWTLATAPRGPTMSRWWPALSGMKPRSFSLVTTGRSHWHSQGKTRSTARRMRAVTQRSPRMTEPAGRNRRSIMPRYFPTIHLTGRQVTGRWHVSHLSRPRPARQAGRRWTIRSKAVISDAVQTALRSRNGATARSTVLPG